MESTPGKPSPKSPEQLTQPSTQKPKSKLFLLLAISAVGLLSAGVGYYAALQQKNIAYVLPSAAPQVVSTPDQTANWKTYTNKEVDFSFKYPSSWKENPKQPTGSGFFQEIND